jgi:hypothetical protein
MADCVIFVQGSFGDPEFTFWTALIARSPHVWHGSCISRLPVLGVTTNCVGYSETFVTKYHFLQGVCFMSERSRLIGLVMAVALLAGGVANKANAGLGACKPVKVCEPVKAAPAVPACKPVKPLPPPEACKPVKPLPPPEACKPVKYLPTPEACKPVKTCDGVDVPNKHAALQDRIARFVSRFKKHDIGKEVYQDVPQPAPSETPPTPAPAPQSPTT